MVSRRLGLVALVLAGAACGTRQSNQQRTAASVTPQTIGACSELACLWLRNPGACAIAGPHLIGAPPGPYQELQILDPLVGTTTATLGAETVSLTLDESLLTLSWTATSGVNFVIVNDALGGEAYVYNPPATTDTALEGYLTLPLTGATFCWGAAPFGLAIEQTAAAAFQRTWRWQIEKSSATSSVSLPAGATVDAAYAVTVSATPADSGWVVTGDIVVQNASPVDATGVTIVDSYAGVDAVLDCGGFDGTLASGDVLVCTYSVALPAGVDGTNVVTVSTAGGPVGGTASAEVAFGAPTPVDDCVSVADDHVGFLGTACAATAPASFAYSLPIGPYAACDPSGLGTTVVNTATFTAPSGATGSSSWTIGVQLPCTSEGCTLTQGYWKTHSRKGPAPYDSRWQNVGPLEEKTPFFLSGQTWYEVFWTPVKGNAYYDLAHQYMAAKLNVLAGASASALGTALATSEAFFAASTPATALTASQRASLVTLASLLDQFNSGLIGPGHCGDRGDDGSDGGGCSGGDGGQDGGGKGGQGDGDHGSGGDDGKDGGKGADGGSCGGKDDGGQGHDGGSRKKPGVHHGPGWWKPRPWELHD